MKYYYSDTDTIEDRAAAHGLAYDVLFELRRIRHITMAGVALIAASAVLSMVL